METPVQMKDALLPSGGVPAVAVSLPEPLTLSKLTALKIDVISFLNNMEYGNDGIHVWRAYGIGPGKLIPVNKLHSPPSDIPTVVITSAHPNSFASVKARLTEKEGRNKKTNQPNEDCESAAEEDATENLHLP